MNEDNNSSFHLAQLKQLTTIFQTCVNGMVFLVLLVSGRFGHAEWNEPYIDVSWLVILVSLSGQSIS